MFNISNKTVVYEEDTKKNTSNLSAGDIILVVVEKGTNARVIERVIDGEHGLDKIIDEVIDRTKPAKDPKDAKYKLENITTKDATVSGFVYNQKDATDNEYVLLVTADGENEVSDTVDINSAEDAKTAKVFTFTTLAGNKRYTVELYLKKDLEALQDPLQKWERFVFSGE